MPDFIPGLQLSEQFYLEAAKPLIDAHFPDLQYSAALIGYGSEVLGFDTGISRDHHWGPRFLLFLAEEDFSHKKEAIDQVLRRNLPHEFKGYPTNYSDGNEIGVRRAVETTEGEVNHFIEFYTTSSFVEARLKYDPRQGMSTRDWLATPEQRLLEITSGKVFWDGLHELNQLRKVLNYYPQDVWVYCMATEWSKISQLEAFVGRCGEVGDEVGSRIVAARIVGYLMRLCFLMERRYAPYPKWFGTGFKQLSSVQNLENIFNQVLGANDWLERERFLSLAYSRLAEMHNSLGLTKYLDENVSDYYGRPYQVLHTGRFADELSALISSNKELQNIPVGVGSFDQLVDQPDVIFGKETHEKIKEIYN